MSLDDLFLFKFKDALYFIDQDPNLSTARYFIWQFEGINAVKKDRAEPINLNYTSSHYRFFSYKNKLYFSGIGLTKTVDSSGSTNYSDDGNIHLWSFDGENFNNISQNFSISSFIASNFTEYNE